MDTSENTARLVENTYKNIIEEFGPCIKQLVVSGRTYLKSIHSMMAAYRNYTDSLSRVATLADHSTLKGSSDVGEALHHIVEVNKEFQTQQSNIMKSLEFDFLEAMEIAADKDTKLVSREQKRFQQLHRSRKEAFVKCISTLKKSRRKKSVNTEKQLAHIKMMESAKARLDEFCEDSLKEAIVQERILYGTVLERQCALNRQLLIYFSKGCQMLNTNLPDWEKLAETREILPNGCFPLSKMPNSIEKRDIIANDVEVGYSYSESSMNSLLRNTPRSVKSRAADRNSMVPLSSRFSETNGNGIYAKPMIRAKSEYNLPSSSSTEISQSASSSKFNKIIEYNDEGSRNCVRALYPYEADGDHQLSLEKGDIIEFDGYENVTGWQYGENVTSGKSGWFPVSYTEEIREKDFSDTYITRNGINDVRNNDLEQVPYTNSVEIYGTLQSKHRSLQPQVSEHSEYGTIQRVSRKARAVEPPSVNSSFIPTNEVLTATLRSLKNHSASQPNIYESSTLPLSRSRATGKGSEVRMLESMHL